MRLLIAAALIAATPVLAQVRATPPDPYIFKSAGELDAMISQPNAGQVYGTKYLNDHENYGIEFVKRLDHGNAVEFHPHWVDQITIVAGEGVLTFGGKIEGGTTTPNGEIRGGTQVGATTQALHPGDFVLIPAGSAHKFDAAPGKTMTYVVAKARN